MTVALLTATFDNFDPLHELPDLGDVEAICVTDNPELRSDTWHVIYEPHPNEHPCLAAKWPKMLPWRYTDAEASVWIDASFRVTSPTFVTDLLSLATPLAQFPHPDRDCAPGDQMVWTTNRGKVRIDELIEGQDRLASWPPPRKGVARDSPIVTGPGRGNAGYGFQIASRSFSGALVCMTTDATNVRVTPEHRVAARWRRGIENAFAVYLMRRGPWWRVGKARLGAIGSLAVGGIAGRARGEQADAAWIVGLYESSAEALIAEQYLSAAYGITQAIFQHRVGGVREFSVTPGMLKGLHEDLAALGSGERAHRLLADCGLDVRFPMWPSETGQRPRQLKLRASNIASGWMEVPTVNPDRSVTWRTVTVTRENALNLPVYSLNVEPHHTYVGDDQILFNCVFDEAAFSAGMAKYATQPMDQQVKRYADLGHPEHWGLWCTGVIGRWHTRQVRDCFEAWMREVAAWSFQDQVSQAPMLRAHDLRPTELPGMYWGHMNPWITWEGSTRH